MLAGFALAVITYFPIFQGITHFANPKLEARSRRRADRGDRRSEPMLVPVQGDGHREVHHRLRHHQSRAGRPVGELRQRRRARGHGRRASRSAIRQLAGPAATPAAIAAAVKAHGYPAGADPAEINHVMTVMLLTILVIYVTMVYGPIAAWLVELFPTRIRYSGLSLPYHIGNGWFGGFLPATVFAIVAATGNIYSGLWYPIVRGGDELRRRADLPARDQGSRHHADVTEDERPRTGRPFPI